MADCPSCGSILRYDIASGKVVCDSCRNSFLPEETDQTQNAQEQGSMGVTVFICPNCGGGIFSTDKDITGVCSYCGSNVIFESRLVQKRRPDLIIPFQKTKEDCKKSFLEHMKHVYFVPEELRDPDYIDSFRGIYMPYWVSDVKQEGDIRYYAKSTEEKKASNLTYHDTYRIKGQLQAEYHGLYHDAGEGFSDDLSEKLEPFWLADQEQKKKSLMKPFYPSYLSGFYAEPADMDFSEYADYFLDIADRQTGEFLGKHEVLKGANANISYTEYEKLDLIDYKEVKGKKLKKERKEKTEDMQSFGERYGFSVSQEEKLAMFPVWFMSWKKNDRVAYLAVNGQTGKVCGDFMIDFRQFFKIFGIIFAFCYAAFLLFTVSAYAMPVYAVWFSALILHMGSYELNHLLERSGTNIVHKKREDKFTSAEIGLIGLAALVIVVVCGRLALAIDSDLELFYSHTAYLIYVSIGLAYSLTFTWKSFLKWKALPASEKPLPVFFLATLAAGLGAGLIYSNTPNDYYLYAGAVTAIAAISASMISMILLLNKVNTRPIPQFEHKGGDDRA